MDEPWTADVAADLQDLARLAALRLVTPAQYEAAGYPSEEDLFQQHVDQTEGEGEDWDWGDVQYLPPVSWPEHSGMAIAEGMAASWPALKRAVVRFMRAWPRHAPLLS